MPKKLEDLKKAIKRNNPKLPESSAYAIANSQLQKKKKRATKKKTP